MVIVLPYQHSDFGELRYALRSISKFRPNDRVILVGDLPDWYNGDHIPAMDTTNRPEFSVMNKILIAAGSVGEDFILWQDDIYQLKECDIKPLYSDTLKNAVAKRGSGRLKSIMQNTEKLFPDGFYYSCHTPMIMNGKKLAEGVEKLWERDCVPKTFYGNYANIGGEKSEDCKLRGRVAYDFIERFAANKDYLSSGHFSLNKDMVRYLNERFPGKCKYEK